MTSYFKRELLPGDLRKGIGSDVATWRDVWRMAEAVYNQCVIEKDSAGWDRTGKYTPFQL